MAVRAKKEGGHFRFGLENKYFILFFTVLVAVLGIMFYNLIAIFVSLMNSTGVPPSWVEANIGILTKVTIFIFLVATIMFGISIVLLTRRIIIDPIKEILKAMQAVGKGHLKQKVHLTSNDEMQDLANTFNVMTEELYRKTKKIEDYSKNLESMVAERTKQLRKKTTQLEKANVKLKEMDKAKDEFINIISHELKNPLFPILGYVELLLDGTLGKINEQQAEKLKVVYKNGEQLQHLIMDILNVTKLQLRKMKFNFEVTNPADLIDNSAKSMIPSAREKKVEIISKMPKSLPKVNIDIMRINEVISNLMTNALKFTPENGTITVSASRKGNLIHVSVKDTGMGIPKEKMQKLFMKFYQVDNSTTRQFEGSGLGLAICKGIIESHKGKIWAESEVGKGSNFIFTLPVYKKVK